MRLQFVAPEKNTRTAPEIVMLALSGDFLPLPGVSLWPSTLFWEATLDEIVEALPPQDVLTLLLKGARSAKSDFRLHRKSSKLCARLDTLQTRCYTERQLFVGSTGNVEVADTLLTNMFISFIRSTYIQRKWS